MPGKSKSISLPDRDKTYIINEVSVKQMLSWIQDDELANQLFNLSTMPVALDRILPLVSNVNLEDIKELYPSEIKKLWAAFREVNSDFFEVAKSVGVTSIAEEIKVMLSNTFSGMLADLSSPVTPRPSTTDTLSS
jgi:hypothetical protein